MSLQTVQEARLVRAFLCLGVSYCLLPNLPVASCEPSANNLATASKNRLPPYVMTDPDQSASHLFAAHDLKWTGSPTIP